MAWVRPISHTANGWVTPENAYDGNLGTSASYSVQTTWSPYLEMHLADIKCNEVRVYVSRQNTQVTSAQIDVYYDAAWNNVYNGSAVSGAYIGANLAAEPTVSGIRVRFLASANNRAAYIHDTELFEVEAEAVEGGSEASVIISAEGQGTKQAAGSSEVTANVVVEGTGIKIVSGGREVGVTVSVESSGVRVVSGGSETGLIVTTEGQGIKCAYGNSEASITIAVEGVGQKTLAQGGGETAVVISAEGLGDKIAAVHIEGGSEAGVRVSVEGKGKTTKQNGSNIKVFVSTKGAGTTNRQGGSELRASILVEGAGQRLSINFGRRIVKKYYLNQLGNHLKDIKRRKGVGL